MAENAPQEGLLVDFETGRLRHGRVLVQSTPIAIFFMGLGSRAQSLCRFASGRNVELDPFLTRCRDADTAGEQGELANVHEPGLLSSVAEIEDRTLRRLAIAETLARAGYNPDEPRVPAGNSDGGQWTSNDDDNDGRRRSLLEDAAYQGKYHDKVVAELAAHWRSEGAKVITSVNLTARNGAGARADLIAEDSSGVLVLAEVKTGGDPTYTGGQRVVYPMAQVGNHVYSPDPKIRELGFAPRQWLPPMRLITIYKYDEQAPYAWIEHPSPIVP